MAATSNVRNVPRQVITTPFGGVLERPIQLFFDEILPPLKYGLDPAQLIHNLTHGRKSSSYRPITKQNRWRGFAKDPADSQHSVYRTFKHIEGIVSWLIKAAAQCNTEAQASLRFETNPEAVTTSDYRTEATLPDASFVEISGECTWKNIAVFGEYEKGDLGTDSADNVKNITFSMSRCLRHDPRRRFVIGFTIVNHDMRFWYCDRSQVSVSEPFNFILDHIPLLRFFLSILYAQPHELGWDTSMVPLPDGSNFDITVRSADGEIRIYRTLGSISDSGTRRMLGKATRVWKAVRLEEGKVSGPPVVLKDYWVGSTDAREGAIAQLISEDIAALEDSPLASRSFVHVEWHGDVILDDGCTKVDCTRFFLDGDEVAEIWTDEQDPAIYPQVSRRTSGDRLVHYRLVLTPICQRCIQHEESFATIFKSLSSVADGALSALKHYSHLDKTLVLRYMHQAQWVHRDVSTGNILLEGDQIYLIDFELAQKASYEASPRIGTDFFRAIEPDTGHYEFTPRRERPKRTEISKARFLEIVFNNLQVERPPRPPPREKEADFSAPARYNPLHDLESLWWVAVYFLLKWEVEYEDSEATPQTSNEIDWDRESQRKYADEVFYDRFTRFQIMTMPDMFSCNVQDVIHPTLFPTVEIMERMRLALGERYTQLEQDPASIDYHCADGFHETLAAGFREIAELTNMQHVKLIPLAFPIPPAPLNAPSLSREVSQGEDMAAQGTGASKEVPKKNEKASRKLRKIAETVVHRYNLRPRPGRK
ncbi:hypothetical protein EIP86_010375 [Pleurotus ostreatoroseus]|nr:hypothetical protein EIP86_010375 [Pleurotus ostreatoroseus]